MIDSTLIADLVRAGVDAELVARVAVALSGTVRDNVRDIVREYERTRKQIQRKSVIKSSGKQTMSAAATETEKRQNVPDNSVVGDLTCLFSASPADSKRRTERKKESQAKRGTRMQPNSEISRECQAFARENKFDDAQIAAMWGEFVDYWVGVPGQRGMKVDWLATWRNRIRFKLENGNANGKSRNGSPSGDPESGHRSWASFALANAREASEKNR